MEIPYTKIPYNVEQIGSSVDNGCFSSCRKVEKSNCKLPRCVMTNGKKRQYCI